MSIRPLKWLFLGSALALLLIGHSYGADRQISSGLRPQMWSKFDFDPKLTDPFFESNEWTYPWNIIKNADGSFEDLCCDQVPEKEPPRLKVTAKCFSNSMGGGNSYHLIRFCEARLVGGHMIDLWLHADDPGHADSLRVRIRNGMFTSHFQDGAVHKRTGVRARWRTKRQKLILGKKEFQKGEVIKGRIDLEYIEEIDSHVATIQVFGVFKTILK